MGVNGSSILDFAVRTHTVHNAIRITYRVSWEIMRPLRGFRLGIKPFDRKRIVPGEQFSSSYTRGLSRWKRSTRRDERAWTRRKVFPTWSKTACVGRVWTDNKSNRTDYVLSNTIDYIQRFIIFRTRLLIVICVRYCVVVAGFNFTRVRKVFDRESRAREIIRKTIHGNIGAIFFFTPRPN